MAERDTRLKTLRRLTLLSSARRPWSTGLSLLLLLALVRPASADMGKLTVRRQEIGNYFVEAFVSPDPPRVGPIEVSVMVQDRAGRSIVDVPITIAAWPDGKPKEKLEAKATASNSTNKLMLSAVLDVPNPGKWQFEVKVEPVVGHIVFPLDVAEPLPAWLAYAGWVLWPLGAVAVFVVHRYLVRRRLRSGLECPRRSNRQNHAKAGRSGND